jgi:DNA topoisomerase-1
MCTFLVIVESDQKSHTLSKILGQGFNVVSTGGAIKEIEQESSFPQDLADCFRIIDSQRPIIEYIRIEAAASEHVLVASDPDVNGELLALHIEQEISSSGRSVGRLLLTELTEKAVKAAIKAPGEINRGAAQKELARIYLERYLTENYGPILRNPQETKKPIPFPPHALHDLRENVNCQADSDASGHPAVRMKIEASKQQIDGFYLESVKGDKGFIKDEHWAKAVVIDLKEQQFVVDSVNKKSLSMPPALPHNTTSLVMEAANEHGFSPGKSLSLARQLYEGLELGKGKTEGVITYPITDSTVLEDFIIVEVREFIYCNFGGDYLPSKTHPPKSPVKGEMRLPAIRPVDVKQTPQKLKKYLSGDQFAIYALIWKRCVASQMTAAKAIHRHACLVSIENSRYTFAAADTEVVFRGFLQAYQDRKTGWQPFSSIARLRKGQRVTLANVIIERSPMQSMSDNSGRDMLNGFDFLQRDSSSIPFIQLERLLESGLVEISGKKIIPTELGSALDDVLQKRCSLFYSRAFAEKCENELEKISRGKITVANFIQDIKKILARDRHVDFIDESVQSTDGLQCPKCGSSMISMQERDGHIFACINYPQTCSYVAKAGSGASGNRKACPNCGKELTVRQGKYGRFLGCKGYPECTYSEPFSLDIPCPNQGCDGQIIERMTSKGKVFYGCSNYPSCDFSSWQKPIAKTCPACFNPVLVEDDREKNLLKCPVCKKTYIMDKAAD